MTEREQYTPGPDQRAQVRRTERSGRSFSSENLLHRGKSLAALPTQRICASGLPLKAMGAWVVGNHGEAHQGGALHAAGFRNNSVREPTLQGA